MNTKNDSETFIEHIETVNQRMGNLYQTVHAAPGQPPNLVIECLEELATALEELRIAEEELRQQNEELIAARHIAELERQRYQELFEFAPDGYLVTDIYGKIQEANNVAARLLNLSSRYLIDKPLVNFVPEFSRRVFRSMLNQLPTMQRVQEWEMKLWRRSDSEQIAHEFFDAAITVETVKDSRNQVIALRWLVRDISARKQAEEQLRQAQLQNLHLVETDRLKTQFMATLSHELRTPMNAILGFSGLLRQRLQHHKEPHMADMVERIFRNGKHLLTLIEELLDFSKLKSHRVELRPEPFDLVELATTTAEGMRSLSDQKALDLRIHPAQQNLIVYNDRLRMQQILINLLSNAIKFTDSGSVSLEIWELPPDRVLLIVSDTGIGIAPTDQTQIFKEFWQADQTVSRRHEGTGLGLAITHTLVEMMQGTITVESIPDRGATFRVNLPCCLCNWHWFH